MATKRDIEIPVTASSGNVFADLGFDEPEEELAKAKLASRIRRDRQVFTAADMPKRFLADIRATAKDRR